MSIERRIVVAGVANLCTAAVTGTIDLAGPRQRCESRNMVTGVSGVGANLAVTLRRLGSRVDLCTLVGQDVPGQAIRAGLEQEGLYGRGCVDTPSSPLAVCLVSEEGHQLTSTYLDRLNDALYPTKVFRDLVRGADLAVLTNVGFARPLIAHAHNAGVPIAVDVHRIADIDQPGQRAWLHSADVLFSSHERLPCSPRQWIKEVFETYPGCLIAGVGRGAEGAMVGTRDGLLISARTRPPRPPANTVGAGDTLFGSFLHGWLAAGNPAQALHDAVLHASWFVGELFPNTGRLDSCELGELARTHPVHLVVDRW
ncbi:fructokinase [Nocardiopsis terrae]|uniref:Sugar/nucleoside kinase (Ribokinase family) n=1 Tax=Nocardiopsis terrae TaxID=372655 RepID=A0ABR9HDT7_9ACTN|nr:carbohydrate kinase family protein [Nocardiopsis terrae]MBE1457194.1 sugar/nucleoside kinase (ribokinase family) [Nocardiopsis terrae]GHC91082.1 fructokinase [Nocardiopsis terrae]